MPSAPCVRHFSYETVAQRTVETNTQDNLAGQEVSYGASRAAQATDRDSEADTDADLTHRPKREAHTGLPLSSKAKKARRKSQYSSW